jgi:hypothetical protein
MGSMIEPKTYEKIQKKKLKNREKKQREGNCRSEENEGEEKLPIEDRSCVGGERKTWLLI